MRKFFLAVCVLLLAITLASAESGSLGGTPTNSAEINYAFAWSAERDEQSAPLADKADLHLTLLKNEWESFFLQVKTGAPDQAVTVEITPFTNGQGDTFEALVYTVGYEAAEDGGLYPQTLTAVDGAPVPLTAGLTTSFFVEFQTGMEIATGDYSATLTMKDASGAILLEKQITATVYRCWMPGGIFIEASAGAKGKLPALTGGKPKTFLGYAGHSYDYFRIALETMGEDWLNENFDNIVAELDQRVDDVDFFAEARPKLAAALSGDASVWKEPTTLQFDEDGNFRIAVFSDIQCDAGEFNDAHAAYYRAVIEQTNPDLIILLGDNMYTESAGFTKVDEMIRSYMAIFEEYGIPVAMVYGNHENDVVEKKGVYVCPKVLQMAMYQTYDCFVGTAGPDVNGVGNYNLPIMAADGSGMAFNLWFIDAGYNWNFENDLGGYGAVMADQIAWYVEASEALKAENGGQPVPSMVFQHIEVPEIYDALVQTETGWALPEGSSGELLENPGSPKYNNGEFAAFVAQGGVVGVVSGHDHMNTYIVPHQGIDLIHVPTCSILTYHEPSTVAVRVIDLSESAPESYETFLVKPADVGVTLE